MLNTVAAMLGALIPAVAGPQGSDCVLDCLPAPREILVDGDLSEWQDLPVHVAQAPTLPAPDDLSARFQWCYSDQALYLAGRIVDDDFQVDGSVPWEPGAGTPADAIELFLDLDREGDRASTEFNGDDIQAFLMPLNSGRRWETYQWRGERGLGHGHLMGLQIETRVLAAEGAYEFEARVPLASLRLYPDRQPLIGFNLAVNDSDAGVREDYLTLNGAAGIFQDPTRMCDLRFVGTPPDFSLAGVEDQRRRLLLGFATALGLLVLLGGIGFGVLRLHQRVLSRHPSWRLTVVLCFAGLGIALWLVPKLVLVGMDLAARSGLETRAERLHDRFGQLGQDAGLTERLRGIEPDAIGHMLEGRGHRVAGVYQYRMLDAVSAGAGPHEYRSLYPQGIPFLEYGIRIPPPAATDEGEGQFRLRLPVPERASRIHLALAAFPPADARAVRSGVEIGFLFQNGAFGTERFTLDDARRLPPGHAAEGLARVRTASPIGNSELVRDIDGMPLRHVDLLVWEVPDSFHNAEGEAQLTELTFSLLPESRSTLLWLSGVTVERGLSSTQYVPLRFGSVDPDGFPFAIVPGRIAPREMRLSPGSATEITWPKDLVAGDIDRLRLYYRVHGSAGPGGIIEGTTRAVVEVQVPGEPEPRRFPLRLGVEVADEFLASDRLPGSMSSFLASSFEEAGVRSFYTGFELPLAEPGGGTPEIQKLVLRVPADAGGEFRVGAITAATEVMPTPLEPNGFLVERRGLLALDESITDLLRDEGGTLRFAVIRDGVIQQLGPGFDPDRGKSLIGTAIDPPAEGAGVQVVRRQQGGQEAFTATVRLPLPGVDVSVLLMRALPGKGEVMRLRNITAVGVGLLAYPFLLLLLVDLLTRLTRIRSRLSFLFLLTSAAPLTVMFLFLVKIVVSEKTRGEESRAEEIVARAKDRLQELTLKTETFAGALLDDLSATLARPDWDPDQIRARLREQALQFGDGVEIRVELSPAQEGEETLFFYSSALGRQDRRWDAPDEGLSLVWGQVVFSGQQRRGRLQVQVAGVIDAHTFQSVGVLRDSGELLALLSPRQTRNDVVIEGGSVLTSTHPGTVVPRRESEQAVERLQTGVQPAVIRSGPAGTRVYDLLRTSSGEPLAVIVGSARQSPLQADLGFLRLDLLWFILVLGAVALVSALFLGKVVTQGLTRPLVELQRNARALAEGRSTVELDPEGSDEVAELTQSFNRMSSDLRRRIHDQEVLSAATSCMIRSLDLEERLDVALNFLQEVLPCERMICLLYEPDRDQLRVAAWQDRDGVSRELAERVVSPKGPLRRTLEGGQFEWFTRMDQHPDFPRATVEEHSWLPRDRGALFLPLGRAGRATGVVVGLTESGRDPLKTVEPTFLRNLLSQISVGLENARLYRHAVLDVETGLYLHSFFSARVGEEVDRASERGQAVTILLMRWQTVSASRSPSEEDQRRLVSEFARELQRVCRDQEVLARGPGFDFEVLIPGDSRERAETLCAEAHERIRGTPALARTLERVELQRAVVRYPQDGRSREYLFDALQQRLHGVEAEANDADRVLERIRQRFPNLCFHSVRMAPVLKQLERVAPSDATALILGETGTGKEVAAQLIHRLSPRADRPFVAVHCAALPEKLLESELFGHERGAFTGADRQRLGRFEQADGGTLFLDEVAEIPLEVQVKLLRVLQERRIQRLGGSGERAVNVRVLAATHQSLEELVARGQFREDLYYRLKVVTVEMPPLRERLDEIPALVDHFLQEARATAGTRSLQGIEPAALDVLHRHAWPGNIRELRNVLQRAVVLGRSETIRREDVELEEVAHGPVAPQRPKAPGGMSGLSARQRQLYDWILDRGSLTSREFVERSGVSRRTALRDLQALMDLSLVVREGSRKAAVYRAVEASPSISPSD